MEAGFGRVEITPAVPGELAGYGPDWHRLWDRVHDTLWARALAIRDGNLTWALVELDRSEFGPERTERVWAAKAADPELAGVRLMVAATHTHGAPAAIRSNRWGALVADDRAPLAHAVMRAVKAALSDPSSARIWYGEPRVAAAGFNRVRAAGAWNGVLRVLRFERDGRPAVALLTEARRKAPGFSRGEDINPSLRWGRAATWTRSPCCGDGVRRSQPRRRVDWETSAPGDRVRASGGGSRSPGRGNRLRAAGLAVGSSAPGSVHRRPDGTSCGRSRSSDPGGVLRPMARRADGVGGTRRDRGGHWRASRGRLARPDDPARGGLSSVAAPMRACPSAM